MKKAGFTALIILFAVLHQDVWNWDNAALVFGFMPVGLAYHAAYSIGISLFWALAMRFAWPSHIEEWAEQGDDGAPAP